MYKILAGFLVLLILFLTACSSTTYSSVSHTDSSCNEVSSSDESLTEANTVLHNHLSIWEDSTYTNFDLGFSFRVPATWSSDNYKIVVSHGKMEDDQSPYSKVSFIFRSNQSNPILVLMRVSKSWWENQDKKGPPSYEYLGEQKDFVYCAKLPRDCPYTDEELMELYNSMVLTYDQIHESFSILASSDIFYADGTLLDFDSSHITIQTIEDQELTFTYSPLECSMDSVTLHIGDAFRVYYTTEEVDQTESSTMTAVQITSIKTLNAVVPYKDYTSKTTSENS